MKSHDVAVDDQQPTTEDVDEGQSEVTLEESSEEHDDDDETIVLVKMRTKFWPAQIRTTLLDTYKVVLCGRQDVVSVKKKDVKPFIPNPELMKGQTRKWKLCYQTALEMMKGSQN